MISFRQHVVTIVAVFLALALGMLAGSAFIQPRLVDTLETRVDEYLGTIEELRGEIEQLRDRFAAEQALNDVALPHLTQGRLQDRNVVVIAQEGVEDDVVDATRLALDQAGASTVILSAREILATEDGQVRADLAELLGLPGAEPAELPRLTAEALADRLATQGNGDTDTDLLHALLTDGYLAPVDANISDATLSTIGGPDQLVVVLAGGPDEAPAMPPEEFSIPLVERLADLGLSVAAGESMDTVSPFVPLVRAGGVDGLVTVDDLDESRGGAALVLGLQQLLLTGDGGDYGVKDDALPLPPLP